MATTTSHLETGLDRFTVQREIEGLFRLEGEGVTEVVLVCHAEPALRGPNRTPGSDPLLSCTGLVQAERLAERLRSLWVSTIYSAPERRAHQTAVVLSEGTERPIVTLGGLSDIEFRCGIEAEAGETAGRFAVRPRWDSVPGFEPGPAFRRRAIETIESVISGHVGERAIVVTHASVINAFISMLLEIPRDVFFAADHTSVSVVRSGGDLQAVRLLNDTSHLESLLCGW